MSKVETYQQEIRDAIDELSNPHRRFDVVGMSGVIISDTAKQTALAALRAQIEPVSGCWYCTGIESHSIATVKTVTDEYGRELGAYDTPYNYCPNCGRRLTLTDSESTQSGTIRSARGDAE